MKPFGKWAAQGAGWIKRRWKLILILAEILIFSGGVTAYCRQVGNLIRLEYGEAEISGYTERGYAACIGGSIDESYDAGLYDIIPEERMYLRKGYYQYTVRYEGESEGSFCWPHTYNTFYNILEQAVVSLRGGTQEGANRFWLNGDLNVALRLYYSGQGSARITGFTIEETRTAANLRLFTVAALLAAANIVFVIWPYGRKRGIDARTKYVFAGLLTIALIASYPLLLPYAVNGHDFDFHLARIEGVKEGLLSGQFPVRINPTFYNGYGYANPVFYGETLLYVPALLRLVGFRLTTCYNVFAVMINLLTCLGSYFCFRRMFGNVTVAMAAVLLYVMSPYRLMDMYIRAAVGEYTAMLFLPFVAYGLFRVFAEDREAERYRWSFLPLVLGLTGIIQSHVLTGEMTGGLILLICGLLFVRTFQRKRLWALVKAALFTIGLNAWFLVPFLDFSLTQNVRVMRESSGELIQKTGLFLPQLMGLFSTFSWRNGDAQEGMANEMPLFLGMALVLGMILCAAMLSVVGREKSVLKSCAGFSLSISLLTAWMCTVYFPWDKICTMVPMVSPLVMRLVDSLQLIWRILSLATISAVVATGFGLLLLYRREGKAALAAVCVVLCLIMGIGGMHFLYECVDNSAPVVVNDLWGTNTADVVMGAEYTLLGSNYEVVTKIFEPRTFGDIETAEYRKEGTNLSLSVTNRGADGYLLLPLFHYKGYQVSSGDGKITNANLATGESNVIQVNIPAGYQGELSVKYVGFWYWRAAEVVSAATAVFLVWAAGRRRHRY